ncbi:MAG TPA: BON domain-containing protein, partial [Kofleriaceae bacterium]|nr:BON domain-containing protein [Kofleriaceae bacterium]
MANQQGNGRNRSSDESDEDYRDRLYRERDRDERMMQRDRDERFMRSDRERMGAWDDRPGQGWDRNEDRNVGWRGRYESGNYLGQGGQQMGNPWGNQMGHGSREGYDDRGYPQYGGGYGYSQYGGTAANRGHYFGGNPGYHDPGHPGGMGLGQHGNFRHQSYSHLGERNFGHLGPEYGAHMSYMGDPRVEWNRGPEYNRGDWNDYTREEHHESVGQRIKHWLQGHRGKGPQGYQRSDERIREHVCEVLSDDDRVDATYIEVAVKNGEVTLSGTVQDRDTKRLAEQCIEDISGVKDVQNNIRVAPRDQQMGRAMTGVGTGSSL